MKGRGVRQVEIGISIKGVTHQFGKSPVFEKLDLDFEKNKIYGLLGKNGSGKTTLLNLIGGQLGLQEGEIRLWGEQAGHTPTILEKVCLVTEREFGNEEEKVKNIFKLYQGFYENYNVALEKRLCEYYKLPLNKPYKKYSRGMKSLVSNIIGICSRAELTLFDEPTLGLDAVNREQIYSILLEDYIQNPRTIILSTHLIEEVQHLLEKVVIIDKGQVLVHDEIEALKERAWIITGDRQALVQLECLKGKEIKAQLGNRASMSYYGLLSKEDKKKMAEQGIQVENIGLQQLFIEWTKGEVFEL